MRTWLGKARSTSSSVKRMYGICPLAVVSPATCQVHEYQWAEQPGPVLPLLRSNQGHLPPDHLSSMSAHEARLPPESQGTSPRCCAS